MPNPSYGDKQYKPYSPLFPTPDDIPLDSACLSITLPNDPMWWGLFFGALLPLTDPENYQQFDGGLDPVVVADIFEQAYLDMALQSNLCPNDIAPFWDEDTGDDATGEPDPANGEPYYFRVIDLENFTLQENIENWFIAAYVAAIGGIPAAVKFLTVAPKFRLAFRGRDYGGIVKIFIDAVEYATVDTYSPTDTVITQDVIVPASMAFSALTLATPVELLITFDGESHNASATPKDGVYWMEVIRKRLYDEGTGMSFLLRQNPSDACQLEQSVDEGENWTLAFDYGLCITPAQQSQIYQTQADNMTNLYAPTNTWIYQDGDTTTEAAARTKALCYAVTQTVDAALDALLQAQDSYLTSITLGTVVLGLIAAILAVVTGGAAWVLFIALAEAALWVYGEYSAYLTDTIVNDPDNREFLYCQMYGYLSTREVSQAVFQMSFTGVSCGTSDQNGLAAALNALLNQEEQADDIYAGFLVFLSSSNLAARSDSSFPDCDLCTSTWCYKMEGDELLEFFNILQGSYSGGVVNIAAPSGGGNWNAVIQMKQFVYIPAQTTVTSIAFYYCRYGLTSQVYVMNDGAGHDRTSTNPVTCGEFSSVALTDSDILLQPVAGIYTNGVVNDGYIQYVIWRGTGVMPFGGCSNC